MGSVESEGGACFRGLERALDKETREIKIDGWKQLLVGRGGGKDGGIRRFRTSESKDERISTEICDL